MTLRRCVRCSASSLGLLMIVSACSRDGTSLEGASLRILAGANLTDTIGAQPTQGLAVQVRGASGSPERGVDVRFDATSTTSLMGVGTVGQSSPGTVAAATTDANGRAVVLVRFGNRSGAGFIAVSVPLFALTDTARYTVQPGAAVRISISPRDTVLSRGEGFRYRGSTVDRANNPRPDAATYESTGSAVTVDNSGNVTAREEGAVRIRVRASIGTASVVDSGNVTVVPSARVAWVANGLWVSDVTGANRVQLGDVGSTAPSWDPTRDRLVFVRSAVLWLVDLNRNVTQLTLSNVSSPNWPQFSADGQWIFFQGNDATGVRIFRIRPDGSGLENLTGTRTGSNPSPSPDGRSIAYASGGSIVVQELATGVFRTLTAAMQTLSPRWSPDGNWIAYVRSGQQELMLIRPDGSDLRRVPGHGLWEGFSWSPDSRWIIGWENRVTLVEVQAGLMTYLPWSAQHPAWRRQPGQ
jgi:WD40 repeat protein